MNNDALPRHIPYHQFYNSGVVFRCHLNKKVTVLDEAPQFEANTTLHAGCHHSDKYGDIRSE
jgi:hypothetical protein